jgi:hypothetical protein
MNLSNLILYIKIIKYKIKKKKIQNLKKHKEILQNRLKLIQELEHELFELFTGDFDDIKFKDLKLKIEELQRNDNKKTNIFFFLLVFFILKYGFYIFYFFF